MNAQPLKANPFYIDPATFRTCKTCGAPPGTIACVLLDHKVDWRPFAHEEKGGR